MDYFLSAIHWVKNQVSGKGANQIHSPFVFSFYNAVLAHPYIFYSFEEIEEIRRKLIESQSVIQFKNQGAVPGRTKTTVGKLALSSLMSEKESQVLFRLVHWMKAETVLELGVCMGITTAYLARAGRGKVIAWEAVSEIAELARQNWKDLNISNIQLIEGKTEDTLAPYLATNKLKIDVAIVDADHRYEATLRHFETLLPFVGNDSCLVFHDIYWSKGMEKAWKEICARPEVTVSIDLFKMGLIFFRKESVKEHFIIRW